VLAAWSPLIRMSTQPTIKALDIKDCRRKWALICSQWRLFREREYLLSAGGFSGPGWVHITSSHMEQLPFLVSKYEDEPEMVLVNVNQTLLAAVTTEENCFYLFAAYKERDSWRICKEAELGMI